MVEYDIIPRGTTVGESGELLRKTRWKKLFEELAKGEQVMIKGDIETLRLKRRSIRSSNHYRLRRYPKEAFPVSTELATVNGDLVLVISRNSEGEKV